MELEQLLENAEFTGKLEKAENLDEVLALVKDQGVEISKAELEAAMAQLDGNELDENSLEAVAGGSLFSVVAAGATLLAEWLKRHPIPWGPIYPRRPGGRKRI